MFAHYSSAVTRPRPLPDSSLASGPALPLAPPLPRIPQPVVVVVVLQIASFSVACLWQQLLLSLRPEPVP